MDKIGAINYKGKEIEILCMWGYNYLYYSVDGKEFCSLSSAKANITRSLKQRKER